MRTRRISPFSDLMKVVLAFELALCISVCGACNQTTRIKTGHTCMDVPFQRFRNGQNLWMWPCYSFQDEHFGGAQTFYLHWNGEIHINGYCLDIESLPQPKGSFAQIWSCLNISRQKFEITAAGEIYNRWTGTCLTADISKIRSSLRFSTCDGRGTQGWSFPDQDCYFLRQLRHRKVDTTLN